MIGYIMTRLLSSYRSVSIPKPAKTRRNKSKNDRSLVGVVHEAKRHRSLMVEAGTGRGISRHLLHHLRDYLRTFSRPLSPSTSQPCPDQSSMPRCVLSRSHGPHAFSPSRSSSECTRRMDVGPGETGGALLDSQTSEDP